VADLVRIRVPSASAPPEREHAASGGDGPRVYLETFGCQMNEADSALIAGRLAHAGYRRVDDPGDADVVLLNTCAIREKAEDRVWGRTSQLLQHRATNPELVIGITGCMAEHLRDKVGARAPYISIVAGPDSYRGIAEMIERARRGERVVEVTLDKAEVYEGLDGVPDDDGVSGQVTIQRGCDKFCSFCVVPFTRGRERAVPPREVLRAVRSLAERGYREVNLLGQTVNSYRHDEADFAALLRGVAQIEGIRRIRFTSPYPLDVSDRLVAAMAELPQVMPQLHLPAQSGSNAVLERMRRGYTRQDYLGIVRRLRAAIPDIALSTDLMVGFCGETEDDHRDTLALMDEVGFAHAFMFRYSDRGITHAARRLEDDVPDEVKARRLQDVITLQERRTRAVHDDQVGREVEVLVSRNARRNDFVVGRSRHNFNCLLPADAGAPGDIVTARVDSTSGHSLFATPVAARSRPDAQPSEVRP
jgi:tRNA-2-methylthio-N6-dimethylallyladenosine synthase